MAKKKAAEPGTEAQGTAAAATETKPPTKALAARKTGGALATEQEGLTGRRGFEHIKKSELILPRIKLLQALSLEVAEGGEKAGSMFLVPNNTVLGTKVTVIPVFHFRSRIKWHPRGGELKGIDCSAPNAKTPRDPKYAHNCADCKHALWNEEAKLKKDKAPACTLYDNFLALVGDSQDPVVIPFEKTKMRASKRWYNMGAMKRRADGSYADMWDFQYSLETVGEKNAEGQPFSNYLVKDLNKPTPEARKKLAESLWEQLQTATISEKNQSDESADEGEPAGTAY